MRTKNKPNHLMSSSSHPTTAAGVVVTKPEGHKLGAVHPMCVRKIISKDQSYMRNKIHITLLQP